MEIAGIIAEYNPFHNGHKFQIDQTKLKASHIVVVMSGNFVQRGDISIFSKYSRAKAALLNGADLVVEMPTPFSLSCANIFAKSGVFILNQLGINMLSFGTECENIDTLKSTALYLNEIENSLQMKELLKSGISFPTAQTTCIKNIYGEEFSNVLRYPNNALAIEYLRSINLINAKISPFAIKREQVSHDDIVAGTTIASATYLRELIKNNHFEKVKSFIPQNAFDIYREEILKNSAPVFQKDIEKILLYKLRTMSLSDFKNLPDVGEGLENRLFKFAKTSCSIEEFFSLVKTKRYTLAKIRRICYCALIGITKENTNIFPQYIRVLGMNKKGIEILQKAKSSATIPISTKFADLYKLKPFGIDIDITATNIFDLATPYINPANSDFTNKIIKI
ncbi:MAG: nucleotidyltransferase [Oscillospiraceae bacterium]